MEKFADKPQLATIIRVVIEASLGWPNKIFRCVTDMALYAIKECGIICLIITVFVKLLKGVNITRKKLKNREQTDRI